MNKARRDDIKKAQSLIEEARGILENARDEEQDYFYNMPENMQGSEKGEKAEAAIGALEEACGFLEETMSACDIATED